MQPDRTDIPPTPASSLWITRGQSYPQAFGGSGAKRMRCVIVES
jgi:hypothetical protein